MGQWFRTRFTTRRRPPAPAAPLPPAPPPVPEPSLLARLAFWRAVYHAEAERAPSVDQVQEQDAQAQRQRLAAGTDMIAKAIAQQGVWMPHDGPPRAPWD
jgi:hypothetical protein